MPDITMCSPTRIEKKCQKCWRLKAKPSEWQSYANLQEDCIVNDWGYFIAMPKSKKGKLMSDCTKCKKDTVDVVKMGGVICSQCRRIKKG